MKIIDMHCDTIERLYFLFQNEGREPEEKETLRCNRGHLDLKRMQASGYYLQNFALFVDVEKWKDPWEGVVALHRYYTCEIEKNRDMVAPVLSYKEIAESEFQEGTGKMFALLSVEEGAVCKGEIENLRKLYAMGVRMMTLTWNHRNELGYPATPRDALANVDACRRGSDQNRGLTETGRAFVVEMERLGMIPDVSHLSDEGFCDVLELTKKPFVASHSNAGAICPHGRNLSDDMIRKLGHRGGCMGLNFYEDFILQKVAVMEGESVLQALVAHAKHIANVGGVEVLGLGSDFDGIPTNRELQGVQSVELLWNALKRGGFTESDLDKIFYKNVLRVYRECL